MATVLRYLTEEAWCIMRNRTLQLGMGIALAAFLIIGLTGMLLAQNKGEPVRVGNADIGGVVAGNNGPEAGVWVIAETTDLPTKFVRIVVTDDQGRYLVPDLPKANYSVWVRGYGLVDSPKVQSAPGKNLNLKAVVAPDEKAAAEYYPALYWFSLMQMPPKSDFPGTGPTGNGISPNIRSQGQWISSIVNTDGCTGCHQMGDKATREIPQSILSKSANSKAAWDLRQYPGVFVARALPRARARVSVRSRRRGGVLSVFGGLDATQPRSSRGSVVSRDERGHSHAD